MLIHGGDLDLINEIYKIPKDKIIDFSGNITPFYLSEKIKNILINNIDTISTYPDKNYIELKKSIANYCDCDKHNVLVGNGATELISLFIKNYNPKNVIIVSPSYSEYERELKNINSNIKFFSLKEDENFLLNIDSLIDDISKDIDLVILCNPNNPTGTAIDNKQMEILLQNCKFLMVDETYSEFTEKSEYICATALSKKYENLFIIRGTSKFFGMPGIRLGYAICSNQNILAKINEKKDPWSVNSFANIIGVNIFNDEDYINKTKQIIVSERNKILKELSGIKNLKVFNSKSNFILCKILNKKITSEKLFALLIQENILIRDAKNFVFLDDTFFRFSILSEQNNDLLIKKLKNILN